MVGQLLKTMNFKNRQPFHCLEFDYRFHKIIKEIELSNPEILAIQEVDHSWMFSKELTRLGYDLVIDPREKEETYDTGIIAYKKDVFERNHIEHVDYKQFFSEFKEKANSIGYDKLNMKYQFALVLTHKETEKVIIVSNSHFHHDPRADFFKFYEAYQLL